MRDRKEFGGYLRGVCVSMWAWAEVNSKRLFIKWENICWPKEKNQTYFGDTAFIIECGIAVLLIFECICLISHWTISLSLHYYDMYVSEIHNYLKRTRLYKWWTIMWYAPYHFVSLFQILYHFLSFILYHWSFFIDFLGPASEWYKEIF